MQVPGSARRRERVLSLRDRLGRRRRTHRWTRPGGLVAVTPVAPGANSDLSALVGLAERQGAEGAGSGAPVATSRSRDRVRQSRLLRQAAAVFWVGHGARPSNRPWWRRVSRSSSAVLRRLAAGRADERSSSGARSRIAAHFHRLRRGARQLAWCRGLQAARRPPEHVLLPCPRARQDQPRSDIVRAGAR